MINNKDLKNIKIYQGNNEYYILLLNKLENIKTKLFIKDKNYFQELIKFIKNNELSLLNKIDKRKKTDFYDNIQNNITKEIIITYSSENFITNSILRKFEKNTGYKNKDIMLISDYQKYLIDKIVYLNYPYVFKKVIEYVKNNEYFKKYINDIENRTITMLIHSIFKYDLTSNNKFITYLSYWVRHGINEEISIINKDSHKKTYTCKQRFTINDFQDKQLKNLMNYSMHLKEKIKIKKDLNKSFRNKIDNMHLLDIDVFVLFDIDEEKLTQSTVVSSLNNMLKNKENRTILFNYLNKEKIKKYFDQYQIEIQNNKVSLYKCLSLIFLNDFYHNTTPTYNIDEVNEHYYLAINPEYDEYDIYEKLIPYLKDKDINELNKFKYGEIDDLPIRLKKKILNLLEYNNNEEKILTINKKFN